MLSPPSDGISINWTTGRTGGEKRKHLTSGTWADLILLLRLAEQMMPGLSVKGRFCQCSVIGELNGDIQLLLRALVPEQFQRRICDISFARLRLRRQTCVSCRIPDMACPASHIDSKRAVVCRTAGRGELHPKWQLPADGGTLTRRSRQRSQALSVLGWAINTPIETEW